MRRDTPIKVIDKRHNEVASDYPERDLIKSGTCVAKDMGEKMADLDLTKYQEIQETLDGFRTHSLKLGDLVDQLPQIIKDLDHPDPEWREEFVSYWWTLEQVHTTAINIGESGRMPADTRRTVDDALEKMEKLIKSALAEAK